MAYTIENNYTGNGTTRLYSFTFPYLEDTDVKVSLNQVDTTNFEFANATQINFTADGSGATATQEASGAPKTSVQIRVYRDTNIDNLQGEFFSGSAIRAQDLNNDFNQTLYVSQETQSLVQGLWTDTTETISSSETWLDSDVHIATCAAIEDKINALMSGGVFSAADPSKLPLTGGVLTGDVELDNQQELRFREADAGGDHYFALRAAAAMAASKTFTLPDSTPTVSGHALKSDTSGVMSWGTAGGAVGPGTDQIFWENDQTCSDDYTITNNKNAGSFGPITVASGKTVTVGAGEVWTVV